MYVKRVQANDIHFGKNKGKISCQIELIITQEEFDRIHDAQWKESMAQIAVKFNGTR